MTLDIKKLFKNLVQQQFSIQHIPLKTDVFSKGVLPKRIKKMIEEKWSEKYLLDCDYIAFFKGAVDKKMLGRLFNAVNKALGDDANLLTKGDLKMLDVNGNGDSLEQSQAIPQDTDDTSSQDNEIADEDAQNASAISDALDEDEPEQPVGPSQYVFLKITLKK